MDPFPKIDSSPEQRMQAAINAGLLRLVDECGQPLALATALDRPVWAHIIDATDGRVHVHAFSAGRVVGQPQYLEMMGLRV